MQAKLLRVLESGEIRRVGENESFEVDVRVVCATHRNLAEMVEEGEFREDLMFRINTFEIHLPALRERTGDIPPLAEHLLPPIPAEPAKPDDELFTPEAIDVLEKHTWPGNVRELANVIEHATILCDAAADHARASAAAVSPAAAARCPRSASPARSRCATWKCRPSTTPSTATAATSPRPPKNSASA